tara:strand:- start:105 stop:329 length:225 start_codon:yes stop_codon:yes gene_type:complete
MNSVLYTNFVTKYGDDQSLGGGFGKALQNNDKNLALKIADVKNSKRLEILLDGMGEIVVSEIDYVLEKKIGDAS